MNDTERKEMGFDEEGNPAASVNFMAEAVAENRRLLGLPPQSTTFCCFKDPHSPRVCDKYRGHDGFHRDSTMPAGATIRSGENQAVKAMELERAATSGKKEVMPVEGKEGMDAAEKRLFDAFLVCKKK